MKYYDVTWTKSDGSAAHLIVLGLANARKARALLASRHGIAATFSREA